VFNNILSILKETTINSSIELLVVLKADEKQTQTKRTTKRETNEKQTKFTKTKR
jgi:hypothetical protein